MAFTALIETVALFLLLMIPGYILGKCGMLPEGTIPGIGNIIMYIAMPALVFLKLLQTDLRALQLTGILCCILLPIALGLGLLFLAKLLFHRSKPGQLAVSCFCTAFPNCGFWSIPLACTLFPDQPEVAVYVSIFNVFNSFLMLTVGVYILSGDKQDISIRKMLSSPVVIAMVLGLGMALSGLKLPQLERFAESLSQLATPLSMLVLGTESAKLRFQECFLNPKVYLVCVLKLIVSPLLAMAALWLLKRLGLSVSDTLSAAVFLAVAVSTALSAPTLAAKFHLDAKYAAALTIGTTVLCVLTMPLLHAIIF